MGVMSLSIRSYGSQRAAGATASNVAPIVVVMGISELSRRTSSLLVGKQGSKHDGNRGRRRATATVMPWGGRLSVRKHNHKIEVPAQLLLFTFAGERKKPP